jgi:hypothetical protein
MAAAPAGARHRAETRAPRAASSATNRRAEPHATPGDECNFAAQLRHMAASRHAAVSSMDLGSSIACAWIS